MRETLHSETVLKGIPLSAGVAVARVCRFNARRISNLDIYKVRGKGHDREIERVKRAVRIVIERLEQLEKETAKKIGPAEAGIFAAQTMILRDPSLIEKITHLIKDEKAVAESAVMVVMDAFESRLRTVDNEYIRSRASDLGDIKQRLLDVLANINPAFQCAAEEHCQRGVGRIVVTEELTPSLTMELDTDHTLGFVTERGGINSHAAILARALGIPAVSGIKGIHGVITCGTEVLVNGDTGKVVISPAEKTLASIRRTRGIKLRAPKAVDPVPGFAVMANISLAADVKYAGSMRADGVGLYRTEFELMAEGRLLDENEQHARYATVMKAMKGRPVIFRMFDAGGDKPFPFMNMPEESNPALGWRGGRLLLDETDLFETQARALAMASRHGTMNVLYPMIVDLAQFLALRERFEHATKGLAGKGIKHGIMFEVPSACIQAEMILDAADFGNVGTNDLIQYLFAVDRNNERVAYDYSPDRQALWLLLENMAAAGVKTGKPLCICGELAGDPRYIRRLLDIGIRSISVNPRRIPDIRRAALSCMAERSGH